MRHCRPVSLPNSAYSAEELQQFGYFLNGLAQIMNSIFGFVTTLTDQMTSKVIANKYAY